MRESLAGKRLEQRQLVQLCKLPGLVYDDPVLVALCNAFDKALDRRRQLVLSADVTRILNESDDTEQLNIETWQRSNT